MNPVHFLCGVLSNLIFLLIFTVSSLQAQNRYDVNNDGIIDENDLRYVAEQVNNLVAAYRGDVNRDNRVDIDDVRELASFLLYSRTGKIPDEKEINEFISSVVADDEKTGPPVIPRPEQVIPRPELKGKKENEVVIRIPPLSFPDLRGNIIEYFPELFRICAVGTIDEIIKALEGIDITILVPLDRDYFRGAGSQKDIGNPHLTEDFNADGVLDELDLEIERSEHGKVRVPPELASGDPLINSRDPLIAALIEGVCNYNKIMFMADKDGDNVLSRDEFIDYVLNETVKKQILSGNGSGCGFISDRKWIEKYKLVINLLEKGGRGYRNNLATFNFTGKGVEITPNPYIDIALGNKPPGSGMGSDGKLPPGGDYGGDGGDDGSGAGAGSGDSSGGGSDSGDGSGGGDGGWSGGSDGGSGSGTDGGDSGGSGDGGSADSGGPGSGSDGGNGPGAGSGDGGNADGSGSSGGDNGSGGGSDGGSSGGDGDKPPDDAQKPPDEEVTPPPPTDQKSGSTTPPPETEEPPPDGETAY